MKSLMDSLKSINYNDLILIYIIHLLISLILFYLFYIGIVLGTADSIDPFLWILMFPFRLAYRLDVHKYIGSSRSSYIWILLTESIFYAILLYYLLPKAVSLFRKK